MEAHLADVAHTEEDRWTAAKASLVAMLDAQSAAIDALSDQLDEIGEMLDAAAGFNASESYDAAAAETYATLTASIAEVMAKRDTFVARIATAFSDFLNNVKLFRRRAEDILIGGAHPSLAATTTGTPVVVASLSNSSNVACGQGGFNQALNFNGSTAVTIPGASVPAIEGGMTIAAWVRQEPGNSGYLFSRSDDSGDLRYYALLLDGERDRLTFFYTTDPEADTHSTINTDLAKPIDDGNWHHIAVIFLPSSTGRVLVYVDGVKAADFNAGDSFVLNPSASLVFGARAPLAFFFIGRMEQLTVYPKALAGSIIALLNANKPSAPTGFINVQALTNAMAFGGNDLVQITADKMFQSTKQGLTIAAEIQQTANNEGYIACRSDTTGNTRYFSLVADGKKDLLTMYYLPSNMTTGYRTASVPFKTDDGKWHQVAVIVSGRTAMFFADGNIVGTVTLAGPLKDAPTTSTMEVGIRQPGRLGFSGQMRNVFVANLAMCPEDVAARRLA
eukprot:Opistho-2@92183